MRSITSRWPSDILLPVLVAALETAAIAPLIHLLFSPGQSLDDGYPAPWPWMLAVIGLVAFWTARILGRRSVALGTARAISLALWLAITVLWIGAEYADANPARLVNDIVAGKLHLLFPFVLAFVAWWRGATFGSDPDGFYPDALDRESHIAWLVLAGTVAVAALVPGSGPRDALDSARLAVPTAIAAGLIASALGQVEQARRTAIKRRGRTPPRMGWLAFAAATAGSILLVAIVIGGVLGQDIWRLLYQPVLTGSLWLLTALEYVLLAVAFVVFLAMYPLYWVGVLVFNFATPADQKPSPPPSPMEFARKAQETGQGMSPDVALALRWALVGVVIVAIALLVLAALRRYRTTPQNDEVDELRESIWSRDLFLQQLRQRFARKGPTGRVQPVDLSRPPASVREAYRNLLVLAARHGSPRKATDSASVFSGHMGQVWPDVSGPITDLTDRYLQVRYGDFPDEPGFRQALGDWEEIRRYHPEGGTPAAHADERDRGRDVTDQKSGKGQGTP